MELEQGRNEAKVIEVDGVVCVEVALTRGKVCLVDLSDWDRVRGYRWHAKWENREWAGVRRFYAATSVRDAATGQQTKLKMHRLLIDAPDGYMVDHRNRDSLDNRRENLRLCTNAQNQANSPSRGGTSRFKGVTWNARKRRWLVAFRANGQYRFVGYFRDEEEAARAFDVASLRANGPFAVLNFPVAA